ncbi:thioredoxin family protein [Candidatus Poribacteria bacterium]|nr:thioredoxin family protein [Candidatus Poribacteria bacterium]
MRNAEILSDREQAIEDLVRGSTGRIAICLGHSFHPGARVMLERLMAATSRDHGLHLLHLGFTEHQVWARSYGVFGTPSLLLFSGGKLLGRLDGVATPEEIERFLKAPV